MTNSFDKDANQISNYRQNYQLRIMGRLLHERIGDYVLTTAYNDQRTLIREAAGSTTFIPRQWNYNLRSNLLKKSRFPISLSLIRNRREESNGSSQLLGKIFENNDFLRLQGSIPGTKLLPKIVYSTSLSQIANQNALLQSGNQFSIAINNQSRDVTAGYSMYYSKARDHNYLVNLDNTYETVSFNSFTRLIDKIRITTQANLNKLNQAQSSNGKINIIPDTPPGTRHTTVLGMQKQSTALFSTQSISAIHSSSFTLPNGKRLSLGADLSETNSISPVERMSENAYWVRANFLYNKRIRSARTSLTISDKTGVQRLRHQEKYHYANTLSISGRMRWKLNQKIELNGEESFTHLLSYLSNSAFRNSVHFGFQSNVSSNIFLDLSVIQGQARTGLVSSSDIVHSRILKGRSNIKLGRATTGSLEANLSWTNLDKPLDKARSARISFANSGLFRNFSTQISGLYSHQTITIGSDPTDTSNLVHFISTTLNANLNARVYAYRISFRYEYRESKFNSGNRYFITISRPITITL
ncbi:MAG: hypothetical protein K9N35_03165 [Candidatus Marinimicrobia bacterium]|nr:hypothetical protein [Candidatus Neomarinimicrobiota bacterium]